MERHVEQKKGNESKMKWHDKDNDKGTTIHARKGNAMTWKKDIKETQRAGQDMQGKAINGKGTQGH